MNTESMNEGWKFDACVVAQLVGMNFTNDFDSLPLGFRHAWADAYRAGAFNACRTIGELLTAYCGHICGRTLTDVAA